MRKIHQINRSTSVRISYILLSSILVRVGHLPTKCIKFELPRILSLYLTLGHQGI